MKKASCDTNLLKSSVCPIKMYVIIASSVRIDEIIIIIGVYGTTIRRDVR